MSSGTIRGFSNAAKYLDDAARGFLKRQQEAETFTRLPAYESLCEAWQECRVSNWDGEGADPIEHETYQNAYRLIEALPSGFPSPEVTAEPDGHFSLEWYRHPRRILSVSVGPNGVLFWAALVGSEDPRGSCQFYGEFPQTLHYWIARICGR